MVWTLPVTSQITKAAISVLVLVLRGDPRQSKSLGFLLDKAKKIDICIYCARVPVLPALREMFPFTNSDDKICIGFF